ncbi:MAG: Sua5/YciO/YrdC/YwlC family protein [Patescibacteria group bacterium]
MEIWNNINLIKVLQDGGVAVMPTDTIYGIVGQALKKNAVERIYAVRKRNPNKPCIILISDVEELKKFSIDLTTEQEDILKSKWDATQANFRSTSIILDCMDEEFEYFHRGTNTLAFRLPVQVELRELILQTGPLIAPSANTEGGTPSVNIEDAKKYFGDSVDLYIDGGEIKSKASRVIRLNKDGTINTLRE